VPEKFLKQLISSCSTSEPTQITFVAAGSLKTDRGLDFMAWCSLESVCLW